MRIDGKETGYREFSVDMTPGTLTGGSDWSRVMQMPVLVAPRYGIKTCTIVLKIPSKTRREAWEKMDGIIKQMQGFHVIGFDLVSSSFRGVLTDSRQEQLLPDRLFRLTLTMKGLEVGEEVQEEFELSKESREFVITNEGTAMTPAKVTIEGLNKHAGLYGILKDPVTMQDKRIGMRDYYFNSGFSADLTANSIVLDGITGTFLWHDDASKVVKTNAKEITEKKVRSQLWNWAYKGLVDAFGIPLLSPGTNTISRTGSSSKPVTVSIEYRPVYM